MQRKTIFFILILGLLFSGFGFVNPEEVSARPTDNITNNQPVFNFPDSLTLKATITSDVPITSVVLEYGVEKLTCGTVVAKAFPSFTPGTEVNLEWTWEMKQSGSLPPGAKLWWRWRYTNENGIENLSEKKTVIWIDSQHDWQKISSGFVNIHWYAGDQAFAQDLLNAAEAGLARLKNDAGLEPDAPIHLYIYGDTDDMKDAILYEPGWTGGLAYPDYNIVIIGIAERDIDWGRATIAHELTHVLVGHLTFSCLGDVPTWLNEGLAVYSEGALDPSSEGQLNDAINNDELLSVRSLSSGFSEVPSRANLSYSQSYSIVKFMIENYGQEKMNSLLTSLRDGTTVDDALTKIYGFDVDGLDALWRDAIGARPHPVSAQPTAQPTPTFVPTYAPFAGASLAITPTPYFIPTAASAGAEESPSSSVDSYPTPGLAIFISVCCLSLLFFGALGFGIFVYIKNSKGDDHESL